MLKVSLGYTDPVTTTKARRATANFLQQGLLPHFILKIFHGILTVIVESVQELGDSNHCSYLKTRYI